MIAYFHALSNQLQSSKIDLSIASELVVATKSVLSEYRTTEYWNKIYEYATQIAHLHSIDIQPTPSRKRRRPAHLADSVILESVGSRENESTSECLKIQFYLPVLDKFIIEPNHHF